MSDDAERLERQQLELEALTQVFADDESATFASVDTPHGAARAVLPLLADDGSPLDVSASVAIMLPAAYPSVPAELRASCVELGVAALAELNGALAAVARDAASNDCECLLDACTCLQREGGRLLQQQQAAAPSPDERHPSMAKRVAAERGIFGRRMIWFHHIKSTEKRRTIVATARALLLRGFCKPGFPGVVAVEGDDAACDAFVAQIRALRWQAMDVRWETRSVEGRGAADAESAALPSPFVELAESAMGEAAALCEAAGVLGEFKVHVLKLSAG